MVKKTEARGISITNDSKIAAFEFQKANKDLRPTGKMEKQTTIQQMNKV